MQNVQKLLILAVLASSVASILNTTVVNYDAIWWMAKKKKKERKKKKKKVENRHVLCPFVNPPGCLTKNLLECVLAIEKLKTIQRDMDFKYIRHS